MSDCERCGKGARLQLVDIAGAQMYVCPNCTKYGVEIKERKEAPPASTSTLYRSHNPRPAKKDALSRREKELADDYPKRIQRGRETKSWSREDLGKKINERVSVISNLEHGHMHPSEKLVKKLERTLDIKLMEEIEDIQTSHSAESKGMTLADFIVYKDK